VLIAVAVAIPLLAVGSDFGARAYAEAQTAHAFQDATGAATPPAVHIRGFPFLTQAASGTLDQVDIDARRIPAGKNSRSRSPNWTPTCPAQSGARRQHRTRRLRTATLSSPYHDLSGALGGMDVSAGAAPGQIKATLSVPLAGDITVNAALTKAGPTNHRLQGAGHHRGPTAAVGAELDQQGPSSRRSRSRTSRRG